MPPEVVALVLVNDEQQSKDYLLQDGDTVKLMAIVGGGLHMTFKLTYATMFNPPPELHTRFDEALVPGEGQPGERI